MPRTVASHGNFVGLSPRATNRVSENSIRENVSADDFENLGGASVRRIASSVNPSMVSVRMDRRNSLVSIRLPHVNSTRGTDNLSSRVGGIQLSGIDWSKIDEGKLEISMPMEAGRFLLPTQFEDAQTQVPDNTNATLSIDVENENGTPKISEVNISFSNALTVLNPASAFKPTDGCLGSIWDTIQDAAGDIVLGGIRVNKDGTLFLDGTVDQPWPLADLPLDPEVDRELLPRLNMDIETVAAGNLVKEAAKTEGEEIGLHDFLRALGLMTDKGQYSLFLRTGATQLSASADNISISSTNSPVVLTVKGGLDVQADGSIHVNVEKNPEPELTTGLGDFNLESEFIAEPRGLNTMGGKGIVGVHGRLKGIRGKISSENGSNLPLEISGPHNVFVGSTNIVVTPDRVRLHNGRARAKIDSVVGDGMNLNIEGTELTVDDGRIRTTAGWVFEGDANALSVREGTLELKIHADDAHVTTDPLRVRIDGRSELLVRGRNIALSSTGEVISGEGDLTLKLDPRDASRRTGENASPLWWTLGYQMSAGGNLEVVPQGNGIQDFVAPFLGIKGREDALVDPRTPAIGAVGSIALKNHLTRITGAPIRKSKRPEILVDGVESYPKRLKMIRNASESICLQTLIFKNDSTGRETVRELVTAAQRGVKVRVLIDTLGNVETLEDLTQGKEIYQEMIDGGVDLILYKDPKYGPLKELIDEIANNDELSDLDNIGLLADDIPKAMSVLRQLAKISVGEGDVSADTQIRVKSILSRLLSADLENERTLSTAELGNLVAGDEFEMARWLVVLKHFAEMNARWHEKSLVVDGHRAILGGMNIADEYMLGGSGARVEVLGGERTAWRDTDVYVEGMIAKDVYRGFSKNWEHVSGDLLPEPISSHDVLSSGSDDPVVETQFIQHRPSIDGDHHITNVMVENIKALKSGQKCYISNAYFLPVGALEGYKTALMDAAARGVDVRILTNSSTTSDLPQINQAATFVYRELIEAGVRVFERTGDRTMHTKAAVFGDDTTIIGSWNADNRSASINSENVLAVYDKTTASKMIRQFRIDSRSDVCREVSITDLDNISAGESFTNALINVFSHLM